MRKHLGRLRPSSRLLAAVGVSALAVIVAWRLLLSDSGFERAVHGGAAEVPVPFRLPPGYVAERIAAPPVVTHPMFACFDDRGRLYVAGSSGHGPGLAALTDSPADVIRCLVDTDGDGRFDESTVFADGLTFPQGVLWHDGAIFVASPPSLWRLEDTDGDGAADLREEMVTGFPFTGIADDLHGPSLGPDGRLYWCVGRFDYAIRTPGGPVLRKGRAPLVMRCRPDGGDVEVFSAAMGNPVEVAFSPEGEPFACGTFLAPDAMGPGLRDGIIHCVAGGVYPVRDRDLNEDKRTGDPLPTLVHLGVAAGSGVTASRGGLFGRDGRLVLFSALYNTHKVARHFLRRDGASFKSEDEDFLVSDDPDFHPTDVLEDADGSLLVIDTGGWFRSCPTSQIARKDVLGGIYRIRPRGGRPVVDPYGLKLDWERPGAVDLAGRLGDPRPAVADRAIAALAARGIGTAPAIRRVVEAGASPRARRNAVWALSRIDGMAAREATLLGLNDPDPSVRLAAVTATGLRRFANGMPALLERLRDTDKAVRRESATALGRVRKAESVPALLAALRGESDPFLEHAAIHALIRVDDREATRPGLRDEDPLVRRGALIALGQMEGGLTPELVEPLMKSTSPEVQREALRVIAARPDWAGAAVGLITDWIDRDSLDDVSRETLRRTLVALAMDPAVQRLVAARLAAPATPTGVRIMLIEAMTEAPMLKLPESWTAALRATVTGRDVEAVRRALATIQGRGSHDFDETLLALARDDSRPDELRVAALAIVAPRLERIEPGDYAMLTRSLQPDRPAMLRLSAARALGESRLEPAQLDGLTGPVSQAGPLVLPRLLQAFGNATEPELGARLVEALDHAPGFRALTVEDLDRVLGGYSDEVRVRAEPLYKRLNPGEAEKAARIESYEGQLSSGDPQRGQGVFFGEHAACSSCHSVLSRGGKVGPDLTTIGGIRTGHDLLEAILYPSASFARGYEPYTVATTDGLVHNGLIARETSEALYLMSADQNLTGIPRSDIEEIEPSRESIMPRGLEARLSRQEFLDLVAFLRSLK